jgi:thioredoxin-like negative regulator of GroEL
LRSVKSLSDAIDEEQERGIATVCGVVGALIFAFCPTPLSQAVISEVYSLNGLFMAATMTTLFIWMWNTQRSRYLYLTCLLWGLGLTNHQTLLFMAPAYLILVGLVSVAALMDLLVAGAMVGMVGFWFIGWCTSVTTIGEVAMGCLIGLPVIGLFVADRLVDLRRGSEAWMILIGLTLVAVAVALSVAAYWYFTKEDSFWMGVVCAAAAMLISLAGDLLEWHFNWPTRVSWKRAGISAGCVVAGLAFYCYSPLASSTNPPMNWGYTRDKDGFWHHLTRGQYEKVKIGRSFEVFWKQLTFFFNDLRDQYTWMFLLTGLAALIWLFDADKRSRKWIVFTAAGLFFTWFLFVFLANPTLDRAVAFNDRVFFIPTHAAFCIWIGYGMVWGLAIYTAHYKTVRWPLYGTLMLACLIQLGYQLVYHHGLEWWVIVQVAIMFGISVLLLVFQSVPLRCTLALVSLLPWVGLCRSWKDNEQRGHLFGWYFGYHMFEPGGGYPSMDKDAILYGGTDPGRFVPTYMIFCPRVHPDVYIITQNALAENTYLRYLRAQYSPSRKKEGFNWLERALGRDTIYPKQDIYISTDEDSAFAIRSYVEELQRRPALPGEQVTIKDGRVNIQGVQAVTALNGIISKQIFDKERDKHSFYVEESFVIAWMYPYLEPYGIIMKINRDPLPKISPEKIAHNRKYWEDYAKKYLISDPRFRRDDDAQRAFSKLRTAHAGVYAWRTVMAPPELRQDLAAEAEFAFRHALELCPFNVEATFRFAEFLSRLERYDDAIKVVETYRKQDPHNQQINVVLGQINGLKQGAMQEQVLRQELAVNPGNLNAIMQLLGVLGSRGKLPEMDAIIDQIILKQLPAQHFKTIAQTYVQLNRFDRVALVLNKYLGFYPDDAQAWYDLTVVYVQQQQSEKALDALDRAIKLNPQFKQGAVNDPRLQLLKLSPRFKNLTQ